MLNSKAPNAEFLFVQLKQINARTSPTYWHPTVAVAKLSCVANESAHSGNRFCHVGANVMGKPMSFLRWGICKAPSVPSQASVAIKIRPHMTPSH